jgi:NAD(P)H-quinone oxidoreductase subunit 5
VGACACLWHAAGSADIQVILASAHGAQGPEWSAAPVLLALAAILSSAQLPLHGWILEVMETPTPVSALLHAGVVNAGGFLLLRFGEVVASNPGAMGLLTVIGAFTAIFGSLAMLPQTSVKVRLAYSTVAQMGFMLLECGLGAFPAALLHIVAHALYKAHAFLSAGAFATARASPPVSPPASMATTLAIPASVALSAIAATAVGAGPTQQPGVFLLWVVLFLGLARIWASQSARRSSVFTILGSTVVVASYAAGQALFARILDAHAAQPTWQAASAAIIVIALMTGLVCLQLQLPGRANSPAWARAYALASNGFYLNTLANRWVLRLWPAPHLNAKQYGAAQ